MKKIRKRYLPDGWYPESKKECEQQILEIIRKNKEKNILAESGGVAGIVPHAGWYFSGDIAALVFMNLSNVKPDVVVLYGGHLSGYDKPLIVTDDLWETPLGEIEIHKDIIKEIAKDIQFNEDDYPDNTIEIQLPFVKYFFNKSKIIPVRLPQSEKAIDISQKITKLLFP